MDFRFCKNCESRYLISDGQPDTGFCSDQCFGQHSVKSMKMPLRKKIGIALLILIPCTAWVMRIPLALAIAESVPSLTVPSIAFLAHQGPEGVEQLLRLILESNDPIRAIAIASLEGVSDPASAHEVVRPRIKELQQLIVTLDKDDQSNLYAGLGRCLMREEKAQFLDGLHDHSKAEGCARALGHLGELDAVSPLCELIKPQDDWGPGRPDRLVARAAEALGRIKDPELVALPFLVPLLKNKDKDVRIQAAASVGQLSSHADDIEKDLAESALSGRKSALKSKLDRIEEAYAALCLAGSLEKEQDVRKALGRAALQIHPSKVPGWAQ